MHVSRCCSVRRQKCVIKKEAEKILKHKDLIIEIQRMWNVEATVIPVITGATGTISNSLRQYLINVPGKHEIKELKKAILGTILSLSLLLSPSPPPSTLCGKNADVKVQDTFNARNNITCSTNCNYRTAATLCTL